MIKPLDIRIRPLGISLALAALCLPPAMAGSYSSSSTSLDSNAQREIVRRQEDINEANRLIELGDHAVKVEDYATAYTYYMDALDRLGTGPAVKNERSRALGKFSQAGVAYAEDLVDHGKYADAEKVAKTIILPQYNPGYGPATALLSHLEQPDYYNKTVTSNFATQREEVAKLFVQAKGYYDRGSYDLAMARYERILSIDPYNTAARKAMEDVNLAKQKYYHEARNETRKRMLWQVDKGWELPVKPSGSVKDTLASGRTNLSRNEAIIAKLNRIIIPSLNLRDSTIRDAVNFLRQASVKLDTLEQDPDKKGVNIFLKLRSGAAPAVGGMDAGGAPAGPATTENTTITLALNNVPLYEALRYVADQAQLKIKIDPVAVSIVPLTDISQELITKEYQVPPTFIPKTAVAETTSTQFGQSTVAPTDATASRIAKQQPALTYLSGLGIPFPQGASAQYIPSGSKLVVRNTQDNIDLIDQIVDAAIGQAPTQVQIQAKFVEINQNNLKELGFDWLLGPVQIGSTGAYLGGGGGTPPDPNVYPFVGPGGEAIGNTTVTSGLRSGQGGTPNSAITVNGIDALINGGNSLLSGAGPAIFGLSGIFTNPQFQFVIRALDQKKGVDLMTAPTVTTKSGNKAVINVIREFRYPTEFDPPQVPQTVGNGNNGNGGGGGIAGGFGAQSFITNPIVTPTTPSAFETRNLGVTLDVTPTVGADNYTIDLDLAPEVVDFDGFINYGSPILTLAGSGTGEILSRPRSIEISPNVINQPIFSTRKVTTSITIWDGMTIAIGGLIREDIQKVQDKVPIIGDIPLVGRLFRSDVEQKLKKNLVIFVTAKLIDAEGKPLRGDIEKEEIVEPLGLPEEIPPPSFDMKGLPAK